MRFLLNIFFFVICSLSLYPQDAFRISGQLSLNTNINSGKEQSLFLGARYIPAINSLIPFSDNIDAELSVNLFSSALFGNSHSPAYTSAIKPYWAILRYSTDQFELRGGLQKINFGSASLLRPLMWFDKLDPRDPLQLTDGVWALLGRYYFLDNTNIWAWGLYGNRELKAWEFVKTKNQMPEFGGRIQMPFMNGEAGISYHFRKTEPMALAGINSPSLNEQRFGLDGKWDYEIGIWAEAVLITHSPAAGYLTNQKLLSIGTDYTLATGNGLNIVFEHLISSSDQKIFHSSHTSNFSALTLSYPVDIFDRITGLVYYDWNNKTIYNFLNWQMMWDNLSINLIAFRNPEFTALPQAGGGNLFAGNGMQVIFIYNH